MFIESLDYKNDCVGYYCDSKLIKTLPEAPMYYSWFASSHLASREVVYAYLYSGKGINESCPEHLQDDWKALQNRMKAFFRSFAISKINLEDNCIFDMIPEHFLIDYYAAKSKITKHILETVEKPHNYDHLQDLMVFCDKIERQKLNIDTTSLNIRIANPLVRQAKLKYDSISPYIKYDMFGTKTGRLSTIPNSFPILQIDKEYRSVVNPTNDWFLELDFNGAELRTFLALAGEQQPTTDIHEWNVINIYNNKLSREEAKKKIFAWLYGETEHRNSEEVYKKEQVRSKYWDGSKVTTYWKREIDSDKHHSLSYIVQSTFADLMFKQLLKVDKFLTSYKSFISFTVHDNIVIDLADDEKYLLPEIINVFSDTEFGKFLVNTKVGSSYGNMRSLFIK